MTEKEKGKLLTEQESLLRRQAEINAEFARRQGATGGEKENLITEIENLETELLNIKDQIEKSKKSGKGAVDQVLANRKKEIKKTLSEKRKDLNVILKGGVATAPPDQEKAKDQTVAEDEINKEALEAAFTEIDKKESARKTEETKTGSDAVRTIKDLKPLVQEVSAVTPDTSEEEEAEAAKTFKETLLNKLDALPSNVAVEDVAAKIQKEIKDIAQIKQFYEEYERMANSKVSKKRAKALAMINEMNASPLEYLQKDYMYFEEQLRKDPKSRILKERLHRTRQVIDQIDAVYRKYGIEEEAEGEVREPGEAVPEVSAHEAVEATAPEVIVAPTEEEKKEAEKAAKKAAKEAKKGVKEDPKATEAELAKFDITNPSVVAMRSNYAKAYKEYMAKSKEERKALEPDLKRLEDNYNRELAVHGQTMFDAKKAELAASTLSPEAQKAEIERYKKTDIFTSVIIREQALLNSEKVESLSPKKQGIIRKGMDWYLRQGRVKRVLIASALSTLAIGAFSGVGVTGVAAMGVVRAGRSLAGSTVGQFAAKFIDNVWLKKKRESSKKADEEELKKFFDAEFGADLAGLKASQKMYKELEEKARKRERWHLATRAAVALVAGGAASYGAGMAINQFSGASVGGVRQPETAKVTPTPSATPTLTSTPEITPTPDATSALEAETPVELKNTEFGEGKFLSFEEQQKAMFKGLRFDTDPDAAGAKSSMLEQSKMSAGEPVAPAPSEFKSQVFTFDNGKGGTQGIVEIKQQMREQVFKQYGDISKAPAEVQKFLNTNSTQFAKDFGFFKPGQAQESAAILKGSTLRWEDGKLIYHDARTGEDIVKYEGRPIFDSDRSGVIPKTPAVESSIGEAPEFGSKKFMSFEEQQKDIFKDVKFGENELSPEAIKAREVVMKLAEQSEAGATAETTGIKMSPEEASLRERLQQYADSGSRASALQGANDMYKYNVVRLFPGPKLDNWVDVLSRTKAGEILANKALGDFEMKGQTDYGHLYFYLRRLSVVTELEPRSGGWFRRAENADQFIIRALKKAGEMKKLDLVIMR